MSLTRVTLPCDVKILNGSENKTTESLSNRRLLNEVSCFKNIFFRTYSISLVFKIVSVLLLPRNYYLGIRRVIVLGLFLQLFEDFHE